MRHKLRPLIALLTLVALAACQIGGAPTAPTQAPTGAAQAPTTAPTSAGEAAATPAAPKPTAVETTAPIGAIAPVEATIPAGFKPSNTGIFARFQPPQVQAQASVQAPAIAPDLSNVALTALLSPEQRARVAEAGFVVSPGDSKEFYEVYERARYDNVPTFVSSDSLLHVYHLLFDKTLRRAETVSFIPMLTRLDYALLEASVAQAEQLAGTPWAEAARRNAAYFAVAVKLLNPDWPVPEGLRPLADPDLAAIAAHDQIGPSAIFPAYPNGEDWSQYVPRGHYTKTPELSRYFVAMMWHGRMTMRAADATETQQAALLTLALREADVEGTPARALWSGIYEPTVFFVGRSDDLTPSEYDAALDASYGDVADANALVDDAKFAAFQQGVAALRAPQILGMVVSQDTNVPDDTKGLRFMGQRFVPDAFVFRQLIADSVPDRGLPKALDFFAALGSDRALEHLATSGDAAMPNYSANMDKLRAQFASYGDDVWTQNLYWGWVHNLRPLLDAPGEGYPQFMRGDAWRDKQLNTALGSWTELKHDTLLYAKQAYAEGAGGGPPEATPPKGYVEPVPELYARLAALAQMTLEGLDSRGLIDEQDKVALGQLAQLAAQLQTLSEKQLRNEPLTSEEYNAIRFYGRTIENLTIASADMDPNTGQADAIDQAALVADVATDPGGQVLQEGIGRIFEIYVVVPVEGRLVLTKGGVFSHYEFAQPLANRLTDEAWRAQVDEGNLPPLAPWTASFFVEQRAERALAETVTQFNKALTFAFWYADAQGVERFLSGAELKDTQDYVARLKASGQFVGSTLESLEFLSFDFQDATHATVATRERWSDELFNGTPAETGGNPTKAGARQYEATVTYTMEQASEGQWTISRIVVQPEPPGWS